MLWPIATPPSALLAITRFARVPSATGLPEESTAVRVTTKGEPGRYEDESSANVSLATVPPTVTVIAAAV